MASRRGPDGTCRVAISGTINTIPWANIFYFNLTTSASLGQSDFDAWLTAVANAYKTRAGGRQTNQVSYALARAVYFASGGGELISTSTMTGAGTVTGSDNLNNSACAVASWLSSVYWRGGKPRTYFPGIPANNIVSDRNIDPTALTSWKTAIAGLRTDWNALTQGVITGTTHGFVSFRSGNADRVPPVFYATTGVTLHPRLGTQRRRLGPWAP